MELRPVLRTGDKRIAYTGLDERDTRFSRKLNLAPSVEGLQGPGGEPPLKVITDYRQLFKAV